MLYLLIPIAATTDVVVTNNKDDYFLDLKQEILRRRNMAEDIERPVMVFFESKTAMLDFFTSPMMASLKSKTRTISESVSWKEKEGHFAKATERGAITFMIREFGRGTDFKCFDKKLLDAGGVHVIQAFFSLEATEEIQIKGRR